MPAPAAPRGPAGSFFLGSGVPFFFFHPSPPCRLPPSFLLNQVVMGLFLPEGESPAILFFSFIPSSFSCLCDGETCSSLVQSEAADAFSFLKGGAEHPPLLFLPLGSFLSSVLSQFEISPPSLDSRATASLFSE